MKTKTKIYFISVVIIFGIVGFWIFKNISFQTQKDVGQEVDNLNGVAVYYNGNVGNIIGRHTVNGYNLGLKYQCVEFVKRYYYEHLNHQMPDSYGHAKDFFNNTLKDGQKNTQRNLIQYSNPSKTQPKINDLIIFEGTTFNPYGHVAIVSKVTDKDIEITQQNPGPNGSSRASFSLIYTNGSWKVKNDRILVTARPTPSFPACSKILALSKTI